jgi:hypothetical protein
MKFISAEWRKLVMMNYIVPEKLLEEYLPNGVELDLWKGKCFVSLVGFMFENTKVLGLKIPWHVNFEEVNLRFYVKRIVNGELRRGVVFIKEIVPRTMITFVANTLYDEHYCTMKMRHEFLKDTNSFQVSYGFFTEEKWNKFQVKADLTPIEMAVGSDEEFFTEHYWGYTRLNERDTREYHVTHPRWQAYKVQAHTGDFPTIGNVYGNQWMPYFSKTPDSVLLAEGSPIEVLTAKKL